MINSYCIYKLRWKQRGGKGHRCELAAQPPGSGQTSNLSTAVGLPHLGYRALGTVQSGGRMGLPAGNWVRMLDWALVGGTVQIVQVCALG